MAKHLGYRGQWGSSDQFAHVGFSSAAIRSLGACELAVVYEPVKAYKTRRDGKKHLAKCINAGVGLGSQSPIGLLFQLYGLASRVPYVLSQNSSGALHWWCMRSVKEQNAKFLDALQAAIALKLEGHFENSWMSLREHQYHEDTQLHEYSMPNVSFGRRTVRNLLAETMPWYEDYQQEMLAMMERGNPIQVTYRNNFTKKVGNTTFDSFSMDVEELR